MIFVISVASNPNFLDDKEIAQHKILYFLKHLEGLILHPARSTRRISLYIYPALIRILKKLNAQY